MPSPGNPAINLALDANQAAPGVFSFAVTPSDSVDFTVFVRSLYVGVSGNVVVVNYDGSTVTFTAVPAGSILPVCCRRVNATNTSATNIVGIA